MSLLAMLIVMLLFLGIIVNVQHSCTLAKIVNSVIQA